MTVKTKRALEWAAIIIVAVCALIFSLLLSYQQVYAGRVYRNIFFGSVDLSGKSKKEAGKILQDTFKALTDQEFTLSAGEKTVKAKLVDTGLSFDSKDTIEKIYSTGRSGSFWHHLKDSSSTLLKKTVIQATPTIDQKAFNQFVEITVKQLNKEPKNASLSIQDGAIAEITSEEGQTVIIDKLADEIMGMVSNGSRRVELEKEIVKPKVQTADFTKSKTEAEQILAKKIVFTKEGKRYEPTRKEIGSWIVFANKGGVYTAEVDQSNIKAYLNRVSKDFEVGKRDRKVDNNGNVLQEGRDGVYLDKDSTVKQLLGQFGNKEMSVELPIYTETFKEIKVSITDGVETGRFPGKYIDINLSTQRFCRVDGGTLVDCLMTSTGKPSMPTPTGTFSILEKKPMALSSIYGLYMPFWQQFSGPYGIHELVVFPDGSREVVDHLGQTVSHGCVRLGPGTAEMVFNWTEIGTPVYIHR